MAGSIGRPCTGLQRSGIDARVWSSVWPAPRPCWRRRLSEDVRCAAVEPWAVNGSQNSMVQYRGRAPRPVPLHCSAIDVTILVRTSRQMRIKKANLKTVVHRCISVMRERAPVIFMSGQNVPMRFTKHGLKAGLGRYTIASPIKLPHILRPNRKERDAFMPLT